MRDRGITLNYLNTANSKTPKKCHLKIVVILSLAPSKDASPGKAWRVMLINRKREKLPT